MPGSNCAIVGCPACKGRHKGLSFHVIPRLGKNDAWRAELITRIGRADNHFNPDKATVCSRHFEDDCFIFLGNYRKLKAGSLPTKNMPSKEEFGFTSVTHESSTKRRKILKLDPPLELKENIEGENKDRDAAAKALLLISNQATDKKQILTPHTDSVPLRTGLQ